MSQQDEQRNDSKDRNGDQLMTAQEVAALLNLSPKTVYRWGDEGILPRIKMGRNVRFRRSVVEDFIREHEDEHGGWGELAQRFVK